MKNTNRSWRVQAGNIVWYMDDQMADYADVVKVLAVPEIASEYPDGLYLVRDRSYASEHKVTGKQMRFVADGERERIK